MNGKDVSYRCVNFRFEYWSLKPLSRKPVIETDYGVREWRLKEKVKVFKYVVKPSSI